MGGNGDGISARRFGFAALRGDDGAINAVAFYLGGDLVHHRHRFDGELAGSAFRRQHHRIGAFVDGGRHIADLGACRDRRGDHRFQHLRRHHHRLAEAARQAVHAFLQARHFFDRHFDAKIAARHHDRIGGLDDLFQPRDCLRLFDLGEHQRAAARDLLHFRHIVCPLHERDSDPIDPSAQRRIEIGAILLGHGRDRNFRIGQADTLAVRQAAGGFRLQHRAIVLRFDHLQAHLAVVDQNRITGLQSPQDFRMRQIHARCIAHRLLAVEDDAIALFKRHAAVLELAATQFWPLQIDENANRSAMLFFDGTNGGDALAHALMAGVAHVDAKHVGAGEKQPFDYGRILRGRSKRGENLDAAVPSHPMIRSLV